MNIKLTSPAAVAAALAGLMATAPVLAADYVQVANNGSTLVFATKYDGEVFTGSFPGFSTKVSFDPVDPAAGTLDVTIPLAGATSGNSDRDSTLQGAEFFNVAKFATARYTAKGFTRSGDKYVANGTLELRGVSKPVTFTFEWKPGPNPVLTGKATVKRLDFGVGGGEDWRDTSNIPDDTAISTVVKLQAK